MRSYSMNAECSTVFNEPASSTYDAVLDTEAQLVFEIWSLNEDSGNGRTTDNVHLHLNLVLQALQRDTHGHTHTLAHASSKVKRFI